MKFSIGRGDNLIIFAKGGVKVIIKWFLVLLSLEKVRGGVL